MGKQRKWKNTDNVRGAIVYVCMIYELINCVRWSEQSLYAMIATNNDVSAVASLKVSLHITVTRWEVKLLDVSKLEKRILISCYSCQLLQWSCTVTSCERAELHWESHSYSDVFMCNINLICNSRYKLLLHIKCCWAFILVIEYYEETSATKYCAIAPPVLHSFTCKCWCTHWPGLSHTRSAKTFSLQHNMRDTLHFLAAK